MFAEFSISGIFPAARRSAIPFVAVLVVLFVIPLSAHADVYWTLPADQSGEWYVAANWGGTRPIVSDTVFIVNGGTANVTDASEETCQSFDLDNASTLQLLGGTLNTSAGWSLDGASTIHMTAGGLSENSNSGSAYVGYSATGTFRQSGGTNSISGHGLFLGYNPGSSGSYNLGGSGLLHSGGTECVGYSGMGTFTQSGGVNSTNVNASGLLCLGYNTGSSGNYSLISGQFSGGTEYVGYSGTGIFSQSGGGNGFNMGLYLGYNTGSSGSYSLSSLVSGHLTCETEYVGYSGTGTFNQSGLTDNTLWVCFICRLQPGFQRQLRS